MRVFVAGHRGMVGSALVRALEARGDDVLVQARSELDLCDQRAVEEFLERERPETVYLAAAKVGGIHANNTYPAEFIHQNLAIQSHVVHGSWKAGVERLLFLGSSCIYPRDAAQPMTEDALLTGPLEPTNEPYALAKIAGIKLCESYNRQYGTDFRSVMPTNLYGPGDNFHPENSHVLPGLLRRIHEAKQAGAPEVVIWGTGTPMREFLHVDDMAAACLHVMDLEADHWRSQVQPMCSHLNVGTGVDVTIRELAETLVEVIGFTGELRFDTSKPDGTPRKLLDVDRLAGLGWRARTSLREGIESTYAWYCEHELDARAV